MSKGKIPERGYAFRHKETKRLSLMLFLGTGDRLDNYEEVSKEEYEAIKEAERLSNIEFSQVD